jgi:hypothetical protein
MLETTVTYVTSSATEMRTAGLRADIEFRSVTSRNNMMRGTMITVAPTMTSPTSSVLLKDNTFQEASRHIPET